MTNFFNESIMGNLFGCQKRFRVLMLGLDNAGKTTILYKMKLRTVVETITTIGFNTETINYKNRQFEILDFGGLERIRWLWYRYCHDIQGIIFVIDTSDRQRFPESKELFTRLIDTNELSHAAVLIYANNRSKTTDQISIEEIKKELRLSNLSEPD